MTDNERVLINTLIAALNRTNDQYEALVSVIQAPLKLAPQERPWPNQHRVETLNPNQRGVGEIRTRMIPWPLLLKWDVSSRGIFLYLSTADGCPLRMVTWPFSDEPRGENELP